MRTTKMLNRFQRKTNKTARQESDANTNVFGRELSLISRLVGCSHKNMGRPFAEGKTAYRSCVSCGARRQFNPETFETFGNYYSPPLNQL